MRAFVFTDKSLASEAGRFVWLEIDTEKSRNAPFRKQFPIEALPTFLIVDPAEQNVALRWVGGATASQLRRLLDDGRLAVAGGGPAPAGRARGGRGHDGAHGGGRPLRGLRKPARRPRGREGRSGREAGGLRVGGVSRARGRPGPNSRGARGVRPASPERLPQARGAKARDPDARGLGAGPARRLQPARPPGGGAQGHEALGRRTGGLGPGTLQGLRAAPSRDPPDARGHLLGPRRRGVGEADAGRGAERRRGDARGPALRIHDRLDQEEAPGVSLNPAGPPRLARPHPVVTETMRLDVTLFELRLFKSRSQASLAVQDGAVLLNGEVVKPSHGVRPGDRVTLVGADGRRTLEVLALPRISLSKEAARTLVRDLGDAP